MKSKISIGTSGYSYSHWSNGVFYPQGLKQGKWLEHYTEFFHTVELNVTFYRLPQEKTFHGWYKRTPQDFSFAVKGSRFITHIKRLNIEAESLAFLFSRIKLLRKKLAVVLWQFPGSFKADRERLARFFKLLKAYKKFCHAFEFRDKSWQDKEIFRLMEDEGASLVQADWPEFSKKLPQIGPFVYLRRHGTQGELYGGCYSERQLRKDAKLIKSYIKQGKDTFIYFNNDSHCFAVKNALRLKELCAEFAGR